jgi:hypothetical protein
MAIPRFIYEQTSHDSKTGAKAIRVANAEQRKQGRDESRYLARSISTISMTPREESLTGIVVPGKSSSSL